MFEKKKFTNALNYSVKTTCHSRVDGDLEGNAHELV